MEKAKALEGFSKVDNVPSRRKRNSTDWKSIFIEFSKTGNRFMGKTYETNEQTLNAYTTARHHLANHPEYNVRAMKRGKMLILENTLIGDDDE